MAQSQAEAFADLKADLSALTAEMVGGAWDLASPHNEDKILGWLDQILPVVEAAQRQMVRLTDAYLAALLDRSPIGLLPDPLIGAGPRGTPPAAVYRRPWIQLWAGLGEGKDFPEANRAARARLLATVEMDVSLSMSHAMRAAAEKDPSIGGFRRVVRGTCDRCAEREGEISSSSLLFPLHPSCACVGEPERRIPGGRQLPEKPISEVQEHGELGPILTYAGQSFADESQINTTPASAGEGGPR